MSGGTNDSSLTRVQPVFRALAQNADPSWILRLLGLGSRALKIGLPSTVGGLRSPPVFEHACLAPEDLLRWMITNPSKLDWATLEQSKLAPSTIEKRRGLCDGDLPAR